MDADPVLLTLPFTGRWRTENSPARRIPSHGTDLYGTRYAIDFVRVDDDGRSAPVRGWRTLLTVEPPERFHGFGAAVLSPVDGVVVGRHDGEPDHGGRRSPLTLLPYALGQAGRVRRGVGAVAGNHLVIEHDGVYVTLCHLRRGSLAVGTGDRLRVGQQVAVCGGSGNSTEPHVHLQVTDRPDPRRAQGVPLAFRDFVEHRDGSARRVDVGVPDERVVVEPMS